MSLIILGKISSEEQYQQMLRLQMQEKASDADVYLVLDHLDAEDIAVLEELNPTAVKFYFTVNSSPEENEGSTLWNEANLLAQNILRESMGARFKYSANAIDDAEWPDDYATRMKACRLGRFLHACAEMQNYESIGIALIDGGIETEFRGSAEECIEQILRMVLLPWDCGPNTFYVWEKST